MTKPPDFSIRSPHLEDEGHFEYNWIPDFVYGGIDGAITTFAVVAGVEGAELSIGVILILGFANLFADGFSMATGKFLSDKAEKEQYLKIRDMELKHLTTRKKEETAEIREILSKYGFKNELLEKSVETITKNPDAWVDIMMRNEFNMIYDNSNPIKGATATLISFLIIGFIPLFAYTFQPILKLAQQELFVFTSILTLAALFIVGAVKSRFTMRHWLISGAEVAAIGAIAAVIAYAVGVGLKSFA
jgi:VIT1/CCC1 family predicted Fe2+/Mn2+ transporter